MGLLRFVNKIVSYAGVYFKELPANGDQGVTVKAPDAIGADYTLTLPQNAGSAGQLLTLTTDQFSSGQVLWHNFILK